MNVEEELNRVYCRVIFMPRVNRLLVNEKVCEKLTKEAIKRIKGYGIDCIEEEASPRGGGSEPWLEALKKLWELKEYITMLFFIFRSLLMLIQHPFIKHYDDTKPLLTVFLGIRLKNNEDDWHAPFGEKLCDLKYLAQDLSDWFTEKYPIYSFDQMLKLSIYPMSYRVHVFQEHNKSSNYNNGRLLRRLKKLDVKNNLDIDIRFSKYLFLSQTVKPVVCDGFGWSGINKRKTYYTIFSSNISSKYPGNNSNNGLSLKTFLKKSNKYLIRKFKV